MGIKVPTAFGKGRRGLKAESVKSPLVSSCVVALCASVLLSLSLTVALDAPAMAQDDDQRIGALESQNQELLRQNEEMRRQMDLLRQEMQTVMEAVRQQPPQAAPIEAIRQQPPQAAPAAAPRPTNADTKRSITSGQERVKLAISGHVHRAINLADDGDETEIYQVDPTAANSRFRFVGSAEVTDDIVLGTTIEIAVAPNSSVRVSQDNEDAGDVFDQRITELTFDSRRFGKLSVGKGPTARAGTAQVDLSGTSVVLYSGTQHPVDGLKFRQKDGVLTDVKITNAFNNFDGFNRDTRIQYDSPNFAGFSFGTSYAADQSPEAALRWAAEIGDIKAAAAGSIWDPNKDDVDYGLTTSGSILHEGTGLNLTLAGSMEKTDSGAGGDRSQLYLKAGWIVNIFDFGSSHFGVHGALTDNMPTPGDEGWTVGVGYVQRLEDFGTELYTKFSVYDLDRDNDPSVDQILALTFGSRIKF